MIRRGTKQELLELLLKKADEYKLLASITRHPSTYITTSETYAQAARIVETWEFTD